MSSHDEREQALFEAARTLPPDEVETLLQKEGADEAVKRRIRRLLDERDDTTLSSFPTVVPARPEHIGPYALIGVLGEGGMGTVYDARQDSPVKRRVALKLIRPGLQSDSIIARFESERQALALMSHGNIARVFDAGVTDDGRPYFVMEYVDGVPITSYCDRKHLGTRERLALFRQVCDGVQHAHQKGIIHRDIKPSNVLVQVEGDRAVPKIIDFGIAKATGESAGTMLTAEGQLIGTLEYMSPEQLDASIVDVDTRSDVYSLGVLLHELLVGDLPYDIPDDRHVAFVEIPRQILQVEPARPSDRLSNCGDEEFKQLVARNRGVDVGSLVRQLRGDLDCITLKALEKPRSRRYASPAELASDIDRYLANEEVLARPPSATYRMHKFIRRNRPLVAGVCATFVVLVGGIVATTWQAIAATKATGLASKARDEATRARDEANRARDEATEALDRARASEAEAKAITDFLVNDLLAASDPMVRKGRSITLDDVLVRTGAEIDRTFPGQPSIAAAIHSMLGEVDMNLGRLADARSHMRRAAEIRSELFGDADQRTIDARHDLARVLIADRDPDAACEILDDVLVRARVNGSTRKIASALTSLGQALVISGRLDEARATYDEAIALLQKDGAPSRRTLGTILSDSAQVAYRLGDPAAALKLYDEALTVQRELNGDVHPNVARVRAMRADVLGDAGQPREAVRELEAVLSMQRKLFDGDHPDLAQTMYLLSSSLCREGRYGEAESMAHDSLAMLDRLGSPDSADALLARTALGTILTRLGRLPEAARELEAAAAQARILSVDRVTTKALFELAVARRELGEMDAAIAACREVLRIRRAARPAEPGSVAQAASLLAQLLTVTKDLTGAEPLFQEAYDLYAASDESSLDTATAVVNLGMFHRAQGKLDEAAAEVTKGIEMYARILPPGHVSMATLHANLGVILDQAGRSDDALEQFRLSYDIRRSALPLGHYQTLDTARRIADELVKLERPAEAEPVLREALDDSRRSSSSRPSSIARAAGSLGACLTELGRYDEAEPLLVESYEICRDSDGDAEDAAKARERLAALYAAWGKDAEAARWR